MARVIGIGFGLTNCCVAVVAGREVVVIPSPEGSRTTPTMVAFTSTGERLIGELAKRQAFLNPENTIDGVGRLLGRKHWDRAAQRHGETHSYQIVAGKNGDAWVSAGGRLYSPVEISAMVLGRLRQTAEDHLGEPVRRAVISVPPYFDAAQRQATRDAAQMAGLEVLRLINDPTAAAGTPFGTLGPLLGRERRGRWFAVYRLGGSSLDVSILEHHDDTFELKAVAEHTRLGGEAFDRRVADHLADRFLEETGIDLRRDRMAHQRLRETAERVKHELSSTLSTDINVPFIAGDASGPRHLTGRLTRGKLETLVDDLVEKTLEPCRVALAEAGVTAEQIDELILIGGQTRMPRVQTRVAELFKRTPTRHGNPDEVVAIGAAIQGGALAGDLPSAAVREVVSGRILDVSDGGAVVTVPDFEPDAATPVELPPAVLGHVPRASGRARLITPRMPPAPSPVMPGVEASGPARPAVRPRLRTPTPRHALAAVSPADAAAPPLPPLAPLRLVTEAAPPLPPLVPSLPPVDCSPVPLPPAVLPSPGGAAPPTDEPGPPALEAASLPVPAAPPSAFAPPATSVPAGEAVADLAAIVEERGYRPEPVAGRPAAPSVRGNAVAGVWNPPPPPVVVEKPRRRFLLPVLLAAAALTAVGWIVLRPRPRAAEVPAPVTVAGSTVETVPIVAYIQPDTATVQLDGVTVETLPRALPRDGRKRTIRVTAPGHLPAEETFVVTGPQLIKIVLLPVPEPASLAAPGDGGAR